MPRLSTTAALALAVGCISVANAVTSYEYSYEQWGTCSVTCGTGTMTRSVRCTVKGSTNVPLSNSFCSGLVPTTTKECSLPPCVVPTPPSGATTNVGRCPGGIESGQSRMISATVVINDAAGETTKTLFATDFKVAVKQAVLAGPVVMSYKIFDKNGAEIQSGEKVGQALTDNSWVLTELDDLALMCDTVPKGKGTFSITMNEISPSIAVGGDHALYIDPEYYSRQKLYFFWPNPSVPQSPDMMKVVGDPLSKPISDKTVDYLPYRFLPEGSR